jgi:Transposase, Mutator family
VHAVAVNRDGFRESLGLEVVTSGDGAAWLAFLRSLVVRGLAGVKLVTSDAHPGLVDAIAASLPGASWQRCRTHFMRTRPVGLSSSSAASFRTLDYLSYLDAFERDRLGNESLLADAFRRRASGVLGLKQNHGTARRVRPQTESSSQR